MKARSRATLVVCVSIGTALSAAAQIRMGAARAAQPYWSPRRSSGRPRDGGRGAGGGIVRVRFRMFGGADVRLVWCVGGRLDADSTAVGWAESFDSAAGARQTALSKCGSRGGSGCTVRVWGCNGPVVEEGLGPNQAARRQVGGRVSAIRNLAVGARGYRRPDISTACRSKRLRCRGGSRPPASAGAATSGSRGTGEVVFWQSIQNSTNPVEFEAYLEQFPNGLFRVLAQAPLAALCGSTSDPTTAAGQAAGGSVSPAS